MGGYRLLYVVKSKNGKNVFLCQYIHSFVFPEMAGSTPINPPLTFVGKTYRVHQKSMELFCHSYLWYIIFLIRPRLIMLG